MWSWEDDIVETNFLDRCGSESPRFSPDGQALVTQDGQWLEAWDLTATP
jgi:hypothetical protein